MSFSPYLQAIQNVAGNTPGEKYRTLNYIARTIAEADGCGDSIHVQSSPELPEILKPFVALEIAKIIHNPDGIVEALHSDDATVFNLALRVKWFFDGSVETVTNVTFFRDRILGWISVKNRLKLIKILSIRLAAKRKSDIAEHFYSKLSNMYGPVQSEPLLWACSESFIWDSIITRQLVLSSRTVEKLFFKYPDTVVEYLKLSIPTENRYDRNIHKIPINNYRSFLPRLLRNHTDVFVELIVSTKNLDIKLSRKSTKRFVMQRIGTLIEKSSTFGPLMDLKFISYKLTEKQFRLFFRNLFPIQTADLHFSFSFMQMYSYLEFFPSSERTPLILSIFEELYGKKFVDFDNMLTPDVMRLLSPRDREYVARRKSDKDPSWVTDYWNLESSWVCYLPIAESISILKERISKTPEVQRRRELLKQLIYTCRVNEDENALLEILEYICTRHKNECIDTLASIIERLIVDFEIQNLSQRHWEILDQLINIMYIRDHLRICAPYVTKQLLHAKIHHKFICNLSITEPIKSFCHLMKDNYDGEWNILTDHPVYERQCLEEFLKIIPSLYTEEDTNIDLLNDLLSSINIFNSRISKSSCEIEPIALDNEWLLTHIPRVVNSNEAEPLRQSLKKCNLVLYNMWVTNNKDDKMINWDSDEEFHQWRRSPDKIESNWEKYLQECQNRIHKKYARKYIKICRWHPNIPIKFAEKCLKNFTEYRNPKALTVLSLLVEDVVFEHLIAEFLRTRSKIDTSAENAKENLMLIRSIVVALSNVNPPVSLDITAQLCQADTIHITANWLKVLSRQTPINHLIPFVISMMDKPVSISKHFIRVFSTAANIDECYTLYINLWRNEKHQTIRTLVFEKIFNLFVSNPNDETWLLITECIDNLTVGDKEALNSTRCLQQIPDKYVAEYVQKVIMIPRKFDSIVDHNDVQFFWSHVAQMLRLPDKVAVLFPEELHHEILTTYFMNLCIPSEVSIAAQYYLINAYINPALDKLESRLNFYSNMFTHILKNQWDVPDSENPNFFPANYMVDSRMIDMLHDVEDAETRRKFIDVTMKSFLAVLNPLQAPSFFPFYVFASVYHADMSKKDYANKIVEVLPVLIGIFGVEFISSLGVSLERCLKLLGKNHVVQHDETLAIMEYLLESKNEMATLLVSTIMLGVNASINDERYLRILKVLCEQKNPAVVACGYMQINRHGSIHY